MPLLGFRWWHLEEIAGVVRLKSWVAQNVWSLDWNTAQHVHGIDGGHIPENMIEELGKFRVPTKDCWCGFYGWYRLERVREGRWDWPGYLNAGLPRNDHSGPTIAGAFMAAGRIFHHEAAGGFRCEYAKPVALVAPTITNRNGKHVAWDHGMTEGWRLAQRLGLPLLRDDQFERKCQEWGELLTA